MLLLNKEFNNIVEGTKTNPTEDAYLISKWEAKKDKARSCILLSLSDNVLLHVSEENETKDAWIS